MQDVSTKRTWTLSGQSVRFGALFAYVDNGDGSSALRQAWDPEELEGYEVARRMQGHVFPRHVESMALSEIHVGDYLESAEVLRNLKAESRGHTEVFFAEVEDELSEADAAEGLRPRTEFKFFFRFHDIDDALRFKLQFGHVLDAGMVE